MATYTDHQQRELDRASGEELDRVARRRLVALGIDEPCTPEIERRKEPSDEG